MDLEVTKQIIPTMQQVNSNYRIPVVQEEGISLHEQIFGKMEKQRTEDIFTGCEYDGGREVYYGDSTIIQSVSMTDKPYFKRLDSIPSIPEDVKNKVREKIVTSDRRIHSLSDETLCTYVIQAYQELGLPFDIQYIANIFGIVLKKSNVCGFLSKATTRDNPTKDNQTSINIIIVKPSSVIVDVFNEYISTYSIVIDNLPDPQTKLFNYMRVIETAFPVVTQYSAREIATVTIYLYLKNRVTHIKKSLFSKTIFYSLSKVTDKKFTTSCELINGFINFINSNNPQILGQFC